MILARLRAIMTSAIASKLETLTNFQADCTTWEDLDPQWQQQIEGAIVPDSHPSYFISPHSQESLAEVVKLASKEGWTILPCGNGSKLDWGGLVNNPQLVISTQKLDRIVEHAVGDLTVTVEAGVRLSQLQTVLQQVNQFLPLDPTYPDSATIGGIVATADAGSWRQRYGGVRDLVLGLSFVRADGKIAKAGGRVVKNVAGYDLMKLFAGSYGTLGIISQVTFRAYPIPETSETIVLTGEANAIATAAGIVLKSGLTPTAADLLSPSVVRRLEIGQEMGLMVRFQSIAESVKEQVSQLEKIGQELGLQSSLYRQDNQADLWQRSRAMMGILDRQPGITCKIGILPTAAVNFLERFDRLTTQTGFATINVGSGLGRLRLEEKEGVLDGIKEARSLCQGDRGFLTILEAATSIKAKIEPWGYTGNALEMMNRIQQKFDRDRLFSPARFL